MVTTVSQVALRAHYGPDDLDDTAGELMTLVHIPYKRHVAWIPDTQSQSNLTFQAFKPHVEHCFH